MSLLPRLTPSPKIIFSVQTGMLTSLCAIASLIAVGLFVVVQTHAMFLILTHTDNSLAQHLHIHLLLFPSGAMYV
jgi:hypothetical protein